MSWSSLKEVVDKSMMRRGLKGQIQESWVLKIANQELLDFFGPEFQDKARAIYFKNGVLTIAILSDKLLPEISSSKQGFIEALNNKLDNHLIDDLRFLT